MTDEEKQLNENMLRVAGNLIVLLDVGLFPGKLVAGLSEARGFVENIANDTKARLAPTMTPPPAPTAPNVIIPATETTPTA